VSSYELLEQRARAYAEIEMQRMFTLGVRCCVTAPGADKMCGQCRVVQLALASAFIIGHGAGLTDRGRHPWQT
jgi:hypothetical protein